MVKQGLIFLIGILILFFSPSVYSRGLFDEIVALMKAGATRYELNQLRMQYKGERIAGEAYVVSVSKDESGNVIVNLSTERPGSSAYAVDIIIFVREDLAQKVTTLKKGTSVYFSGEFEDIRMRSLVIRKGLVS